jgi:Calcineurin-like phosphoesterase
MTNTALPGKQRRKIAAWLLTKHPLHSALPFQPPPFGVSVVCISDTLGNQPALPLGDILIHAGNLTETGTFEEYQRQLTWLSSQPYQHKILIAGNKDAILDDSLLHDFPGYIGEDSRTRNDLDFAGITYLQDESALLNVTPRGIGDDPNTNGLAPIDPVTVKIYGSPWTPKHGIGAFQYPPEQDIWHDKIPSDANVIITHGPPALHLNGTPHSGDRFLAREIASKKPRLVVFGHVSASRGRQDVLFDKSMHLHDEAVKGAAGWGKLVGESVGVGMARLKDGLRTRSKTTLGRSRESQ